MKVPARTVVLLIALPLVLVGCGRSSDGDLRRQVAILKAQLAEAHAAAADCRRKVRAGIDVQDTVGSGPGIAVDDSTGLENAQGDADNSSFSLHP